MVTNTLRATITDVIILLAVNYETPLNEKEEGAFKGKQTPQKNTFVFGFTVGGLLHCDLPLEVTVSQSFVFSATFC